MTLFEVKGWDVPSTAVIPISQAHSSRKRKRPANDVDKVQSVQVNLEKLMRKVDVEGGLQTTKDSKKKQKRRRERKGSDDSDGPSNDRGWVKSQDMRSNKRKGGTKSRGSMINSKEVMGSKTPLTRPTKRAQNETSQGLAVTNQHPMQHTLSDSTSKLQINSKANDIDGLTSLQSRMKQSLHGSRFRWINEVLYTSGSADGHKLMREEPTLYEEYHIGFRQQVQSWPNNPVSYYITELSSYSRGTVIVDLGCGDAALAKSLIPQGHCVLSFDLVSDSAFVQEADICQSIPLPGSADGNLGQVVDICVCALSLMSVDWIKCIMETWRILRIGGELKIAEVTSRFTDIDQFLSIIEGVGYKFKSKDSSNTHFTLFEFQKNSREPMNKKNWEDLQMKHTVLKPCEYKRR